MVVTVTLTIALWVRRGLIVYGIVLERLSSVYVVVTSCFILSNDDITGCDKKSDFCFSSKWMKSSVCL